MKKAFEILKDRPRISIVLTRDSVCAGDDCDAPHEKVITIHSFTDPEALAREASAGYLANVDGIGHSWVCELNGEKIAVIWHEGIRPLIRECTFQESNRIHFVYRSASC